MFGRRRHPVLATAVVVGASRSAAKREVDKQASNQAQYEQDVQREAERRKMEEEEQEARTQRAVDDALRRAGVAGVAAYAVSSGPPGDPQYQSGSSQAGPSSMSPVQQQGMYHQGSQAPFLPPPYNNAGGYTSTGIPQNSPTKPAGFVQQGGAGGGSLELPGGTTLPRAPTPTSLGAGVDQYCPACGSVCKMEDMFCRRCGRKQDGRG